MARIPRDDLLLILSYCLHLAKADDDVSVLEKNLIRLLVEKLNLSAEERKELAQKAIDPDSDFLNIRDEAAKRLLIRILCAVSHSDGILHYTENQLISTVNERLGHPEELRPWEQWGGYEEEVLQILRVL